MIAFILFALFVSMAALIVLWREARGRFLPPTDKRKDHGIER